MSKATLERGNGLFQAMVYSAPSREAKAGSQGKNLEAGTAAERTDHQRNGARSFDPHGLVSMLSYITQDNLPQGGTADSGLGPPTSKINQENAQVILVCVTLTKTSQAIFTALLHQKTPIRSFQFKARI